MWWYCSNLTYEFLSFQLFVFLISFGCEKEPEATLDNGFKPLIKKTGSSYFVLVVNVVLLFFVSLAWRLLFSCVIRSASAVHGIVLIFCLKMIYFWFNFGIILVRLFTLYHYLSSYEQKYVFSLLYQIRNQRNPYHSRVCLSHPIFTFWLDD